MTDWLTLGLLIPRHFIPLGWISKFWPFTEHPPLWGNSRQLLSLWFWCRAWCNQRQILINNKHTSYVSCVHHQSQLFVIPLPRTLQWHCNERDGVSNHQPHDCLPNRLLGANQRKHQSSASLAFVRGIHRWPVNSPHKGPVMRKRFPFHDIIMTYDLSKQPHGTVWPSVFDLKSNLPGNPEPYGSG